MLSRVANSIYWLNRYMERVENYARIISVNLNLSYDMSGNLEDQWAMLLEALQGKKDYQVWYGSIDAEHAIDFLTFEKTNNNSIVNCLENARENARSIKETLPKEMWEHINSFYLDVKGLPLSYDDPKTLEDFYTYVKKQVQLYYGMSESSLLRGEGYFFSKMGQYMERSEKTSRLLSIGYFNMPKIGARNELSQQDMIVWPAVLKSTSALNMYRQQYKSLNHKCIIEFLVKERNFPRSLNYCIRKTANSLSRISGINPDRDKRQPVEKLASKLLFQLDDMEYEDIMNIGIHNFLFDFQSKNNALDQAIFEQYFI